MGVSLLYDDANPVLTYYGTQWAHSTDVGAVFNDTISVCHTEIKNTTLPPSLSLNFYGSEFNLYGLLTDDTAMNYSIDSSSVRPAIFSSNVVGKNSANIWSLQGLDDNAYHTVELFPSSGLFTFDYITVTPNKYSTLTGRNLILDDTDPALLYSGNWSNSTGAFGVGVPFNETTAGTQTKGSSMKLNFVGSSISVYGLLNQQAGKLSVSFSVDGKTPTTFSPFDGSQSANTSFWRLAQQFYHQDLVPGSHSLLLTLDDVTESQKLWIDSVVFEGTSATPLNQTTSGSGTGSGSGSISPTSSSSNFSNGAIGGLVVAGIVLMIIFFCVRARIQRAISNSMRNSTSGDLNTYIPPPPAPAPQPQPPQIVYVMQNGPPMPSMPNSWSNASRNVSSSSIAIPTPYSQPPQQYQPLPTSLPPPRFETTQPYRDPHPAPSAIVPPPPPRETTPVPTRPTVQEADAGPVDAPPPYNENLYIP